MIDLKQNCVNEELLVKVKQRALQSKHFLLGQSAQNDVQYFSNDKELCTLDIASALKNPLILNIIQDSRICVKDIWKLKK